jgi:anionic cell wall polymer biosynthesis LytR-Cps2A-Psr (LCP) family protein
VTTRDPASQLTWTAGPHHLDGVQALQYVRDHNDLASSDFGHEQRQQNYLRAMFQQVRRTGTLANPLRAGSVMLALPGAVSVDSTLSDSEMLHLVLSLRGLSMSRVVFASAPSLGTGRAGGQSIAARQVRRSRFLARVRVRLAGRLHAAAQPALTWRRNSLTTRRLRPATR